MVSGLFIYLQTVVLYYTQCYISKFLTFQNQRILNLALRTAVMERPLLTSVSAIQPPIFAKTAMVNHGKTQKSPDSVRLNFKT
jgi:hypothetical protein